jgi:hypothetical protein
VKPKLREVRPSSGGLLKALEIDPNSLQGRMLGNIMDSTFTHEKPGTGPKAPVRRPPVAQQQRFSREASGSRLGQETTPRERAIYNRLSTRATQVRQLEQ